MTEDNLEELHRLWDALADCEAAKPDVALDLLLSSLCELVDAQNANWIGAVRLADVVPVDPVHGWRPRYVHYLHAFEAVTRRAAELTRMLEAGVVDVTAMKNVALAGRFRCNRLVDLAPPEWFESDYYRVFYRDVGHVDVIWSGCPVSADAEVYFGLFRDGKHPPFTPGERDTVAAALRGLRWFHRQTLLSRGLLVAEAPLTAAERDVLRGLLGGRTEKQIAADLNQSPNTTHSHVGSIYRKFGVRNRAALMALWLGKAG